MSIPPKHGNRHQVARTLTSTTPSVIASQVDKDGRAGRRLSAVQRTSVRFKRIKEPVRSQPSVSGALKPPRTLRTEVKALSERRTKTDIALGLMASKMLEDVANRWVEAGDGRNLKLADASHRDQLNDILYDKLESDPRYKRKLDSTSKTDLLIECLLDQKAHLHAAMVDAFVDTPFLERQQKLPGQSVLIAWLLHQLDPAKYIKPNEAQVTGTFESEVNSQVRALHSAEVTTVALPNFARLLKSIGDLNESYREIVESVQPDHDKDVARSRRVSPEAALRTLRGRVSQILLSDPEFREFVKHQPTDDAHQSPEALATKAIELLLDGALDILNQTRAPASRLQPSDDEQTHRALAKNVFDVLSAVLAVDDAPATAQRIPATSGVDERSIERHKRLPKNPRASPGKRTDLRRPGSRGPDEARGTRTRTRPTDRERADSRWGSANVDHARDGRQPGAQDIDAVRHVTNVASRYFNRVAKLADLSIDGDRALSIEDGERMLRALFKTLQRQEGERAKLETFGTASAYLDAFLAQLENMHQDALAILRSKKAPLMPEEFAKLERGLKIVARMRAANAQLSAGKPMRQVSTPVQITPGEDIVRKDRDAEDGRRTAQKLWDMVSRLTTALHDSTMEEARVPSQSLPSSMTKEQRKFALEQLFEMLRNDALHGEPDMSTRQQYVLDYLLHEIKAPLDRALLSAAGHAEAEIRSGLRTVNSLLELLK